MSTVEAVIEGSPDGSGPAGEPAAEAAPPLNRMVLAVLALLGALVSAYLLAYGMGLMGPLVCGLSDCATVQSSPWARLGPFPVAGLGLVGWLALLGLALAGLQPRLRESGGLGLALVAGTTLGMGFSAWLTWLEATVIHAWCQWCVASAVLMALAFLAALPEARRLTRRST
jgi:uncharacterized membrane protein